MTSDFYKTSAGFRKRIDALSEDFTYGLFNNALVAYGEKNKAEHFKWIGNMDARICAYCSRFVGRVYRTGQYLPRLPAHVNCRCNWEIIPD